MIGASLVTAACLVISPLDEVNEQRASTQTDGGGSGGTGGVAGAAGGGGSAGALQCAKHSDCVKDNVPSRCVDNQCVEIRSPDCPCVPNVPNDVWKEDPDDTILIAAFAPLDSTATDECEDEITWNYRLAVQEFNDDSVQGLPGPNGKPRRIALVVCDNQAEFLDAGGNYDLAKQLVLGSMKHLTEDLKVPGILAYVDLGMMQDAFTQYAEPTGTLFLTPHGPSNAFATSVPDENNLAWHMLGLPTDLADTYVALVAQIAPIALTAPLLDADGGVTDAGGPIDASATNPLRIAIVRSSDAFSDDLTLAVESKLFFNGKSWTQNVADDNAHEYSMEGAEAFGEAWTKIHDTKPHIVLSTGRGASAVMEKAGSVGTKWKPYVVFSPFDIGDVKDAALWIYNESYAINDLTFHNRFMWVNVAGSEDIDLLDSYKEHYTAVAQAPPVSAENAYDAAYYLIYSMYAATGPNPPNGLQMGQYGMPKLIAASPPFNVGPGFPGDPTKIFEVLDELEKPDGKIRLNGTLGPPFFDSKGIRRSTGEIECLVKTPSSLVLKEHVGHFDQVSKTLRLAKYYAGSTPPCLDWLGLPSQ